MLCLLNCTLASDQVALCDIMRERDGRQRTAQVEREGTGTRGEVAGRIGANTAQYLTSRPTQNQVEEILIQGNKEHVIQDGFTSASQVDFCGR